MLLIAITFCIIQLHIYLLVSDPQITASFLIVNLCSAQVGIFSAIKKKPEELFHYRLRHLLDDTNLLGSTSSSPRAMSYKPQEAWNAKITEKEYSFLHRILTTQYIGFSTSCLFTNANDTVHLTS